MKKTIMAVAALLPLCAGLMAQNLDDSEIYSVKDGQLTSALDSIVVSASRVDAKSPVAYSEMDKEALRLQSPASSLPMMLSLQPSVVTTNEGGTGLSNGTLEGLRIEDNTIRNLNGETISLYDATGRLMIRTAYDINLTAMPAGIYLLRTASGTLKLKR